MKKKEDDDETNGAQTMTSRNQRRRVRARALAMEEVGMNRTLDEEVKQNLTTSNDNERNMGSTMKWSRKCAVTIESEGELDEMLSGAGSQPCPPGLQPGNNDARRRLKEHLKTAKEARGAKLCGS